MSEDALAVGGVFLILGFILNIASPQFFVHLNVNLGIWGIFFVLVGIVVIAIRLRSMGRR